MINGYVIWHTNHTIKPLNHTIKGTSTAYQLLRLLFDHYFQIIFEVLDWESVLKYLIKIIANSSHDFFFKS
jgi:hypothetical protein